MVRKGVGRAPFVWLSNQSSSGVLKASYRSHTCRVRVAGGPQRAGALGWEPRRRELCRSRVGHPLGVGDTLRRQ